MDYSKFKELLAKAMGSDSMGIFAKKADSSVQYMEYLCSALDYPDACLPDIKFLVSIVIASRGRVTLHDLKTSLGYDVAPEDARAKAIRKFSADARAKYNRDDIAKGFNEIFRRAVIWKSPEEVLATVSALYCVDCTDYSIVGIRPFGTPCNIASTILCKMSFSLESAEGKSIMEQYVLLYVSRAGEGKSVLSGWAFDSASMDAAGWGKPMLISKEVCYFVKPATVYRKPKDRSDLEKLMSAIFEPEKKPDDRFSVVLSW